MPTKLLTPEETDDLLRYPPGKAERLARRGKLPHIRLPDDAIRFKASDIESLMRNGASPNAAKQEARR